MQADLFSVVYFSFPAEPLFDMMIRRYLASLVTSTYSSISFDLFDKRMIPEKSSLQSYALSSHDS